MMSHRRWAGWVLLLVVLGPVGGSHAQEPGKGLPEGLPPSLPPALSLPGPNAPLAPEAPMHPAGPAHDGGEHHSLFLVEGEYFLLRPRRRSQDYAIVGTNPNLAPLGAIKSVEGGYDSGFRIGLGYRCPGEGWDVRFLYSYYHTTGDDSVRATGDTQVFPTLTHPAFVTQVTAASAVNSINLNLYDLEVGRRVDLSESLKLRLFAGPRFASVDQKYQASYTGGDVRDDTVRRQLFFDGGGIRVGGELDLYFLEHIGFYLRGSGSLLTGRFSSTLSETANGVVVVNVDETFDNVVPILDLGIGLRYQRGNFRLAVGYELQHWFGMVEGFDFVDDAHPAKMTRRAADLGFDGFVLRAEIGF